VRGNKDDAADARAIWMSAQHADIRRIPVKGEQQQAELSVHRLRSHWVSLRTSTINALRGLLYEFGVVLSKGRKIAMRQLAEQSAQIEAQLPPLMNRLLHQQLSALREIDAHVAAMDHELETIQATNPAAKRLCQVPGIGVISASALASTLGDGRAWRNAREFACCMGLTPAHTGTGGKVRMGKISKRGDAYIRTLLIHGARNLVRVANPPEWIASMLARRPFNVVATAVAHKLARIAWAMVANDRSYEKRWQKASAQTC
jgi:transposase